jgi:transglutaminase-like putative cysteine protease
LQPDPGVEMLDQYWPGRSFDTFDGREWTGSGIARQPRSRVDLGRTRGKPRLLQVELLPGYDSRTLVALDRPVMFANAVQLSATGSARATLVQVVDEEVRVNENANAYSYQAYSLSPDAAQEKTELDELDNPEKYTRLPKIDARVEQKAAEIVAGETDPLAAGHKLEQWLRSSFSYSLELGPETEDPLATFLFDRKEGHCEHFATALAVMLRSQGFAARVTAGFFGGERIADAYVVRAGDAHAWVQVFEPATGWVLLDATPPSGRGARPNALLEWMTSTYEWLQAQWRSKVIDYSFQDQLQIAQNLVRPPKTGTSSSLSGPPKEAWLTAAVVAMVVYAAWRLARGGKAKKKHPATGFLGKIEDRLRGAGIAVQAEEPLEELVVRLEGAKHPVAPAARAASSAYLGARFGGRQVDAATQIALLAAIELDGSRRDAPPPSTYGT